MFALVSVHIHQYVALVLFRYMSSILTHIKRKKNIGSHDYFYLTSTSKDKLVTLVFVLSIVTERSHRNIEESI